MPSSPPPPLTRPSIIQAHALIKPHIHRTPVLTSSTLDRIASTARDERGGGEEPVYATTEAVEGDVAAAEKGKAARPKIQFFFKCENFQKVGAFKARGAFHALARLGRGELERGVVTHSSGNHAQALALAARTYNIPAHIVMPHISTPSKIAGTRSYGAHVLFSGSTSTEREAVVAEVVASTGATLVPPYDDANIILGQGTAALELEEQVADLLGHDASPSSPEKQGLLNAVITPVGGGGLLSGTAIFFHDTPTRVFGAEPTFQGGDDARRGLAQQARITSVKTLTIADGLRTPLGELNWGVISDCDKVAAIYGVGEEEIKMAMRLVLERMKVVIEPSAAVPLAACLYNEEFRRYIEEEQMREGKDVWRVGVVFSGGNTTVEGVGKLFGDV